MNSKTIKFALTIVVISIILGSCAFSKKCAVGPMQNVQQNVTSTSVNS